ncbi:GNAT family N-acetyltransferase [Iodobacter sp. CM08]|uniref:GNAT family N-acetyltransferase n=1 Tax=Iodobacter sp. CM08 TaxID=3085902 RepID=UPI0029816645|nr:GNAT family N-acetyltransferase [Iodobacter sp. CM08]MDW5419070.1 GNAT family N-acetyltransferase [Iodobacter sp. CM08]
MNIIPMTPAWFSQFWPTFAAIIQAEETYAFEAGLSEQQAYELWCVLPTETFVLVEDGELLGSYYIKPNASGPGAHVCNCGYMVAAAARGKGVAQRLCLHSQQRALALRFKAMQFNAVVSTNTVAVALWQKLGFEVVGRVPKAYQHKSLGLVDTLVMYKWLAD